MLKLYGHAVRLDPEFAEAHARLAKVAYDVARVDHYWVMPTEEAIALVETHTTKALELEPENATALATLSHQALELGETERALDLIDRAVAVAPGDVGILAREAYILARSGRYDDAVAAAELVLRLEPSPSAAQLIIVANTYFHGRRYPEAAVHAERARAMGIRPVWALETLLATYARLGDQEKMVAARTDLERVWPTVALRWWHDFYVHPPASLPHWLESLRIAGVPEWPNGIEPTAATMLTRDEVTAIYNAGTQWVGASSYGWRWRSITDPEGNRRVDVRSPQGREIQLRRGPPRLVLDEDGQQVREICHRTLGDPRPREQCLLVLRNPGGSRAGRDEYLNVTGRSVGRFATFPAGEDVDWRTAPR